MQDKLNQDSTWNMKVLLESNTIQDNKFWASLAFLNKIFPQSVFSSKARSFCGINLLLNKIDMNAYWGAQVSHYIACPFQCSMGVLISILACTYLGWEHWKLLDFDLGSWKQEINIKAQTVYEDANHKNKLCYWNGKCKIKRK